MSSYCDDAAGFSPPSLVVCLCRRPFAFYTKYEKIKGSQKQFYMLSDSDIKTLDSDTLWSRDAGHLVGEIRGRWTNHYPAALKSLYAVEEEQETPAAEETAEETTIVPPVPPKPETLVSAAASEAAAMVGASAKERAGALIAKIRIQQVAGKAITRQHERWIKDYPGLQERLEAQLPRSQS